MRIAHQCNRFAARQFRFDALKNGCARVVTDRQIASPETARDRRYVSVRDFLALDRVHRSRCEILNRLAVPNLIHQSQLIPVDQTLDWRWEVLVGGNGSDERTDIHLTVDNEIAADCIKQECEKLDQEIVDELPDTMSNAQAGVWIIVGMALLQVSSKMLVYGASNIAQEYGISDVIIGSTIIAIGTSLPELAASVAGVLKNEDEMALGNVIGSNIFNLLAVLSLPGIIVGLDFQQYYEKVIFLNVLPMIGLTIAMGVMSYSFKNTTGHINRYEGGLLNVAFIVWLVFSALNEMGH